MACRYAWECQTQDGGWGLDGVLRDQSWKLRGIVNGIDTKDWSPVEDPFLSNDNTWGYRTYNVDTLVEGKAACKRALQRVRLHALHACWHWAQRDTLASPRPTLRFVLCDENTCDLWCSLLLQSKLVPSNT